MGALLYHAALHAERTRHDLFSKKEYPTPQKAASGEMSVKSERQAVSLPCPMPIRASVQIWKCSPRELICGFLLRCLLPVEIAPPKRLRDLLWLPAKVRTSDKYEDRELGEVLLPVLTPFAAQHPDPAVRLGRATVWEETADGEVVPVGQKMLLADDEEWPILELRNIQIAIAQTAS